MFLSIEGSLDSHSGSQNQGKQEPALRMGHIRCLLTYSPKEGWKSSLSFLSDPFTPPPTSAAIQNLYKGTDQPFRCSCAVMNVVLHSVPEHWSNGLALFGVLD